MYFEILNVFSAFSEVALWGSILPFITHICSYLSEIGKSRVIFCGESSNLLLDDCLLVPEGQHGEACMHPHRCPLIPLTGGSYTRRPKLLARLLLEVLLLLLRPIEPHPSVLPEARLGRAARLAHLV